VRLNQRRLRSAVVIFALSGILIYGGLHLANATGRGASPITTGSSTPAALSSPEGSVPPAIQAMIRRGPIVVRLTITPADLGTARIHARVWVNGRVLQTGGIRFMLSMPSQPIFPRAILAAAKCHGGYCARGELQALGRWQLEVLVCPRNPRGTCAPIIFDFMNGANARFLFARPPDTRFGSAEVNLTREPQGSSILRVHLRPALTVHAVVAMPNMPSMGTAYYAAGPQPHGWYAVSLSFPMTGVTEVRLQVWIRGVWRTVRTLLYDVDSAGGAQLITTTASSGLP